MDWIKQIKAIETEQITVELLIDNTHKVTYAPRLDKRKLVICWYYNRDFKIEYFEKTNEIGQLFGNPRYFKLKPKEYLYIKKSHGKKKADKLKKQRETNPIMFRSCFSSARSLITHLKNKQFKTIEVINTNVNFLPF